MFERTYNSQVLLYDEDFYDRLYKRTLPDGRTLRYGRELLHMGDPPHWATQEIILRRLGVDDLSPILIVGCGFSPLLTAFNRGRLTRGTDPSPYIQKYQSQESDSPHSILPYAVPDPKLTDLVRAVRFRWVISDDALSSLDADCIIGGSRESEAERFIDGCSDLGEHVIHFVTTGSAEADFGSPLFSYRTLEEWQQYEPNHFWVDVNSYEVLTPYA